MDSPVPILVEKWPDVKGGWLNIDNAMWLTRNVLEEGVGLDQVMTAHLDPATGKSCKHSGARLGLHQLVSREPLTLSPSLACGACSSHGFIRDGRWINA